MRRSLLAAVVCGLAMHATQAAESAKAASAKKVDAERLEFLGSIDVEEEGWQEYLEQKPVKPAEKKPARKAAPATATPEPAKQVKDK